MEPSLEGLRYDNFKPMKPKTMAEYAAAGIQPEILFWVGCAGSFDERARKITLAFCQILEHIGMRYGILGNEESCTGDPARRAGNEFLFQMMALQNIHVLNAYHIQKLVTTCPHCFNTLKNEYPALGGHYEVWHHTQLIQHLLDIGKIRLKEGGPYQGKRLSYHDSCYLGRGNGIYEAPRAVLQALDTELTELKHCRSKGLCCGAGGGQMFKEEEQGQQRVNQLRASEILDSGTDMVVSNCPFCMNMLRDGLSTTEHSGTVEVVDLAELVAASLPESSL